MTFPTCWNPNSVTLSIISSNFNKSLIFALVLNLFFISLISFAVRWSISSMMDLNYYTLVCFNKLSRATTLLLDYLRDYCWVQSLKYSQEIWVFLAEVIQSQFSPLESVWICCKCYTFYCFNCLIYCYNFLLMAFCYSSLISCASCSCLVLSVMKFFNSLIDFLISLSSSLAADDFP